MLLRLRLLVLFVPLHLLVTVHLRSVLTLSLTWNMTLNLTLALALSLAALNRDLCLALARTSTCILNWRSTLTLKPKSGGHS